VSTEFYPAIKASLVDAMDHGTRNATTRIRVNGHKQEEEGSLRRDVESSTARAMDELRLERTELTVTFSKDRARADREVELVAKIRWRLREEKPR
jgi:hypothetical protein